MITIDWNDAKLKEAIVGWTGYGSSIVPQRNVGFITEKFGDASQYWLDIFEKIFDEFYKTDAHLTALDLNDMKRIAILDFKKKHKETPEAILTVLAWCYTFDYK